MPGPKTSSGCPHKMIFLSPHLHLVFGFCGLEYVVDDDGEDNIRERVPLASTSAALAEVLEAVY